MGCGANEADLRENVAQQLRLPAEAVPVPISTHPLQGRGQFCRSAAALTVNRARYGFFWPEMLPRLARGLRPSTWTKWMPSAAIGRLQLRMRRMGVA